MLELGLGNYREMVIGGYGYTIDIDLYNKCEKEEQMMICEYVDNKEQFEAITILSDAAEQELIKRGFSQLDQICEELYVAIRFQMNKMGLEKSKIDSIIEEYRYYMRNKKRMPK